MTRLFHGYLSKILLLALLYVATGKLGLMLAVPPGFATIVWPPSGIALGALLLYGSRLWPGVFLGSCILNAYIAGLFFEPTLAAMINKSAIPLGIAVGSTLQAIVGYFLIKRFITFPLQQSSRSNLARFFLLVGPLGCVVSSTFGVSVLYFSDVMPDEQILSNWLTWWIGDTLGAIIFTTIVLAILGRHQQKEESPVMPLAMLLLVVPLAITLIAWKDISKSNYEKNLSHFNNLVMESENAMRHRLKSHEYALLGGVGFFQGSSVVSREEWRAYVESINIEQNFPGINGMAYVAMVPPNDIENFVKTARQNGAPDFTIHPTRNGLENFIVTYIEPMAKNKRALGLNLAFENNRREAALLARDTGMAAISKRIMLVQDTTKSSGFLLFLPLYERGKPIATIEERHAAFKGWINAPILAKHFFDDLTIGQKELVDFEVYDGEVEAKEQQIYDDEAAGEETFDHTQAQFIVRKKLDVMQQPWTLVWRSTPALEATMKNHEPLFVLVGGLIFTGLLGVYLWMFLSRAQAVQHLVAVRTADLESATSALKRSEERYDLVVHGMSVGLWDWDVQTNKLFWSGKFKEIVGIDKEFKAHYDEFARRLHPEDKEATEKALFRHVENKTPYNVEYRLRRNKGDYVWIHATGQAQWDKSGKAIRMAGSVNDITARKDAERLVQEKISYITTILNTVVDGIITINARGTIESFNPAAERMFGYQAHEVTGKNVNMLMPEPYHSEHDGYLKHHRDTGEKKIIGIGREVQARRKDGSIFSMELAVSGFEVNGQKMFVGSIRDITERKVTEDAQRMLMDQVMKSNTELERFAYIASHDMQEPIRMITSFGEIIAKDYGNVLDNTGKEYLRLVVNSGQRMRDLVEDLLAYSRVGNESLRITSFNGENALEGVFENLKGLIDEQKAEITHDALPKLYGNPIQFMRLLQNLVTNGIKYQREGNQPKIHIGVEDQGSYWCISVKDNGLGIKEEFVEQVFQPFRRLHTWDKIQGTGLGLSICRKIAENHGGRIWVTSTLGEGSMFLFTISKQLRQEAEAA